MGMLLCEQNFRDVWSRNESVRAEIGQLLHTHTHAAKLVVEILLASLNFSLGYVNIHTPRMHSVARPFAGTGRSHTYRGIRRPTDMFRPSITCSFYRSKEFHTR